MLSPTYEITTALSHTDELISPPYDIAIVTISYGRVTMSSVWDSMMSKKNMGWPFYAAVVRGQRASILYPNLRCGSERITLSDTVCWGHGRIQPVCVPGYNDVIMGSMASQITIVYSAVYSGADQRKHQSSASLVFVHRWPVTREMFPFNDVIMRLVFDIVSIHSSAISRKIYRQNCHLSIHF